MPECKPKTNCGFRHRLHEIIFEADTPAGKLFDIVLILSIIASVVVVPSVPMKVRHLPLEKLV